MTSAERARRFRENQMRIDPDGFRAKEKARKKAAHEARKIRLAQQQEEKKEEQKEEQKEIDAKLDPAFTKKLKELQKLINKYLTKQTQLSIPEIQVIMKKDISMAIPLQNFLNCDAMKEALYQARLKHNKDNTKYETLKRSSWNSAWRAFWNVYMKYVKPKNPTCGVKDFNWLHDADQIIKFVKSAKFKQDNGTKYADSTRTTTLQNMATVVSVLKGFEQSWKKLSEVGTNRRNKETEETMENQFTAKELKKHVPWTLLVKASEKAKGAKFKALTGLYTLLAPRRIEAMQWLTLRPTQKGWKEDPDRNYYDPKKKEIVLNNYKTFKKYKRWVLKVPTPLKKLLADWIKERKIQPGEPMFPKGNSKVKDYYAENGFGDLIKRAFKSAGFSDIGVNVLRHSIVSNFYEQPRLTENMKNNLARDMGHDRSTQGRYNRLPPVNDKNYKKRLKQLMKENAM